MVKLGVIPSNFECPYLEQLTVTKPTNLIAPSTALDVALATFTLPWAGSVMLDVAVCGSWDGRQQMFLGSGAGTSPAPGGALGYTVISASPICFAVCPAVFIWGVLAKGQVVSFTLRITAGAAADGVQLDHIQANYRAWMT